MKSFSLICNPGVENPELLLTYLKKDNVVYIDSLPYEGVDIYAKSRTNKVENIKAKILKRVKSRNFR